MQEDQQNAIDHIIQTLEAKKGVVFLLHGSEASRKIEVYLRIVEETQKRNQGAIVLVPEIGLTFGLVQRFKAKIKDSIAIIHSGLTDKERTAEWQKALRGEVQIVIGTRLAIFAPVKNLKVVILDEEHDASYKQEQAPRYHARAVAEYLSENMGIATILGSNTPSIETFYKAQTGKYRLLEPYEKTNMDHMPKIEVIDMRKEKNRVLSSRLRDEIKEALSRGEKIILFADRRGFFTFAVCRECGNVIQCPNCTASLVYHSTEKKLLCGHCGYKSEANLWCPKCRSSSIIFLGVGTQRVEKEVCEVFPQAKVVRIDRDSTSKRCCPKEDGDIFIGTQMVIKGLNIADVSLVGIVSVDSTLNISDFRSAEQAFQQISQATELGSKKVFIQTQHPYHHALRHAAAFDYKSFYEEELEHREKLFYPPFSILINIIIHDRDEQRAVKFSNELRSNIGINSGFQVLGPIPAAVAQKRNEFRRQILLKGKDIEIMRNALANALSNMGLDSKITIDVEPLSLL